MRTFEFSDVKYDKNFWSILNRLKDTRSEEEIVASIRKLDDYVSSVCEMPTIDVSFAEIDAGGEFFPDGRIIVSKDYLVKTNWIRILSVYLHEKRHHLQYCCYLEKSTLLGEDMLGEIHSFVNKEYKTCAITGASIYDGTLGHDARSMEQDAIVYENEQMIELLTFILEKNPSIILKRELDLLKENFEFYKSYEYASMMMEHIENFPFRLEVEEILLKEIKDKINNGIFDGELKKIIYSKKLYDCLAEEEKEKIKPLLRNLSDRKVRKSEAYLNKLIQKRISERRIQKWNSRH